MSSSPPVRLVFKVRDVETRRSGSGSAYYDNVRPLAYPESDAVLICFDISRPETLDNVLKKWQGETQEYCPNAKVVLVGCSAYYDNVRPLAYPESDAVLICFDISRPETLDNVLKKWQGETQEYCPNAKVVLVGCKLDMRTDMNTLRELSKLRLIPVTHEQGTSLARQIGAAAYAECTSKNSEDSVRDVFHIATVTSIGYETQRLKRSGSRRGLKRASQNPQRSEILERRKDRAKSCTLM
ncbi:hypothetical protein PDJAM_G00031540 [Pangasius djambal]|uniref:Uncharacterized protein n=1 Tax=Pangasius djambal TaxID=1691987 RepID=A0ACC5YRQ5_9TELE|nr:hypothetical protein [Pangasius djambal]